MILLPYQKEWVKNDSKYSIYQKARRVGITLAAALAAVRYRVDHKLDLIFSTSNQKTGREFLGYCKSFADAINLAAQCEYIDTADATSEVLRMPNGSRIIIVSSNPVALRGLGGTVVLDEVAWSDHAEELLVAAQPCVQWGNGQLQLISTHSSPESCFNKILQAAERGENDYKIYTTTIYDAVKQGLALKVPGDHLKLLPDRAACDAAFIHNIKVNCINEGAFKQEFECLFSDQTTIITSEMYDKVVIPNYVVARNNFICDESGGLYAGVDVARTNDRTIVWVVQEGSDPTQKDQKLKGVYRTIFVMEMRATPYATQFSILKGILSHRGIKRALVERNGVGQALAEELEFSLPGKVKGFDTTQSSKMRYVERLAGWVGQQRISLPGDKDLREDILALQRVVSPNGRTSYVGHSDFGHCDAYIAASLALEAAEGDNSFLQVIRG